MAEGIQYHLTSYIRLLFVCLIVAAAMYDFRERRIPNFITFTVIAISFGMYGLIGDLGIAGGAEGLKMWFLGLAAGAGLLAVPCALGGMGAGDLKLLAAAGSMLGPVQVFYGFLAAALLGGLMAIGIIASRPTASPARPTPLRIPYGLPLAAGVLLSAAGAWIQC